VSKGRDTRRNWPDREWEWVTTYRPKSWWCRRRTEKYRKNRLWCLD